MRISSLPVLMVCLWVSQPVLALDVLSPEYWENLNRPSPEGIRDNLYEKYFPADTGFAPDWNYQNSFYRKSPLSAEERLEILRVPTQFSDEALRERIKSGHGDGVQLPKNAGGKDVIDRMVFRAIHYVLGLKKDDSRMFPREKFREFRYRVLRDLFTEISNLPGVKWQAEDYRLKDGTFVFEGKPPASQLLIIQPDGDLFVEKAPSHPGQSVWAGEGHPRSWKLNYLMLEKLYAEDHVCLRYLKP